MTAILSRWGGPAAILGGILWLTYCILQVIAPAVLTVEPYTVLNKTADVIYKVMLLLSLMLFAVGLLGLYARQAGSAGSLAKLGGAAAILGGLLFAVGGSLAAFFSIDGTWYMMMGGIAVLFVSLLLLGVSALRTQVLGRWSFVPLLVGMLDLAAFLSAFMGLFQHGPLGVWLGTLLAALVGVGWVLLGVALLSNKASAGQEIALDSAAARNRWVGVTIVGIVVPLLLTAAFIIAQFGNSTAASTAQSRQYASQTPAATRTLLSEARPVVIDADMALDDLMAIFYLLQRSDIRVEAITVAGTGEVHCEPGVRHARGLLALAGYPQVPVACGAEVPTAGGHSFPDEWRRDVDNIRGLSLPGVTGSSTGASAPEVLSSIAAQYPDKLTVITLGPLTNLADALRNNPLLADQLESVYIMGGAIDVPGNVEPSGQEKSYAEWNIHADPGAADVVFSSGLTITLVPLDATNNVPVTQAFIDKLAQRHSTPVADSVHRLLAVNRDMVTHGYYFWDTFSAALLSDNSLGTFRTMKLRVLQSGTQIGRTAPTGDGEDIRVATSADRTRFEQLMLDVLNNEGN